MSRIHTSETDSNSVSVPEHRIAVLIACYNEEITIGQVVSQFRAQLPGASIYVFDNNSSDRTAEEAQNAGAVVLTERRQGKGYVIQSMFRRIDADFYVMVDGDGTYPPEPVHKLLRPLLEDEADMVIGSRLHADSQSEFKQLNRLGNRLVRAVLKFIFSIRLTDILSGYRAFNRQFVKGLPLFGGGFEIETELTIKAVERGYRMLEIPVDLSHRPAGSHSKIHFMRDSFLILNTTLALFRDYKPLTFFGSISLVFFALGLIPSAFVVVELVRTGHDPQLTWSLFALGFFFCGFLSLTVGLILHTLARRSQEFEYQMQILMDELRSQRTKTTESAGRMPERRD